MSFHASSPLRSTRGVRREHHSSTSPVSFLHKERYTNPPLNDDGPYHIFDFPSSSSCDQPSMTLSILSTSSLDSISSRSGRLHTSFSSTSVGLPSDYPLQRNATGSTTITVEEELEDFGMFGVDEIDNVSQQSQASFPDRRRATTSSCGDIRSLPPESPNSQSGAPAAEAGAAPSSKTMMTMVKGQHHRRRHQRGSMDSASGDSTMSTSMMGASSSSFLDPFLLRIPSASRHRPERNQAMGAKDFHESVLMELFEQVSVTEFQY